MTPADRPWTRVCALTAIPREGGVAALVDGVAIALFRTHDDDVHALDNRDPASGASVMSRGIVGTRGTAAFVASPLYKHPWELSTGRRLDDPGERIGTWAVRIEDGDVLVGPRNP